MYTSDELGWLTKVFEAGRQQEERLKKFLEPVADQLEYDSIKSVDISDGLVHFTADWHGPFQAEDTGCFSFPVYLLVGGHVVIVDYLKRVRDEERARRQQESDAALMCQKREMYERLKKELEPETDTR